ncbi:MAG: PLP-dependent aminotransferase family protein [Clostridium baratii]|uniref:Bacterial regulatory s, gntR family protein n=1 Tax=Clostridium baratii str. Sullivan TaxID=1415775 RepID=A0A0A7FXZ4_9CLOT|nr:PLP-dependent aminotransferase family protein [Clostridium baratii]AIY84482.1 bacterial regulatory s, gntR family protein [Clostridium baratii str. Sullivan]MBS6005691.1 PLP-dependent aminotransferase family protein [Clostridium baratii]MDU1052757.1 PLP-dependent aminotransferase family protein [Clostridium baratii]MDU4910252.1 PLP-dependent aminotransferase family protein [Clostridium baratii]CUP26306.1 GntR family transcriptional regulator [Clostridium baratii]
MIFSSLNLNSEEKIHIQIENHIKNEINNGLLQKGSKLPSTREVSKLLSISRNSVITAYENLEEEGIIESLKGRGTFVKVSSKLQKGDLTIDWEEMINDYGKLCEELDIVKTELPWKKGMISFKSIAPDGSLFDLEEFKRSFLNVFSLEGDKLLNYGYAKGYKPLIEYIKKYMKNKGVSLEGRDVLITNGFTEGFDILLSTLTIDGDKVACEEPTHNTAIKMMKTHNLDIKPIKMNKDGIDIESLEKTLKESKPKFIYLIPSYHNPTGIVIKGEKRQEVYNVCEKYKVPIIEDGFNEELLYSSSHVAPIASLCSNGNGVVYVGSFSKILFPGLRIGWIFGDSRLIDILESVKRERNIHSSFIDQAVFYKYMESGAFKKYMKKIRKHYKDKYNFTLEQVKKYIPNDYILGEGGLHIFIKLKGINGRDVLKECYKKGVVFMPGDIFYNGDNGEDTIRLGFSRVSEEDIEKGIKIIGDVVNNLMNKNKG